MWLGEYSDGHNLAWEWLDTLGVYVMTQEIQGFLAKKTLRWVDEYTMFDKLLKNLIEVMKIIFLH